MVKFDFHSPRRCPRSFLFNPHINHHSHRIKMERKNNNANQNKKKHEKIRKKKKKNEKRVVDFVWAFVSAEKHVATISRRTVL